MKRNPMSPLYEFFCPECGASWMAVSCPPEPVRCSYCGNIDKPKNGKKVDLPTGLAGIDFGTKLK